MKNKVLGVFAAMAIAGTIVAAQSPQPQTPSSPASPATPSNPSTPATPSRTMTGSQEQSLTGCLIQGSGPSVFLLENAKTSGSTGSMASSTSSQAGQGNRSSSSMASESGKTYIVTASASSVDLKSQLNHQVTITGTGDESPTSSSMKSSTAASASSQTARMNEKDMPKFSARMVTKISDTCSSAG